MHESPEDHGHQHADGTDGERAGHAHRERLQPHALEHRETRVEADRGHRRAEENLRRPVVAQLLRDRRPHGGIPDSKGGAVGSQRRVTNRSHDRHRQEPDHEAGHQRPPGDLPHDAGGGLRRLEVQPRQHGNHHRKTAA